MYTNDVDELGGEVTLSDDNKSTTSKKSMQSEKQVASARQALEQMDRARTGTPAADKTNDTEVTRARVPPTATGMDLHEILSETIDWEGEAFSMDAMKPGY